MVSTNNRSLPPDNNLPAPLSNFIGRKREITAVKQLLSENRLLTLTGPGGCGKTRLALHIASDLQADYNDGIWLVEFASLAAEDLVTQVVASVLGVREQANQSLIDSLASHLQRRTVLLVLDNCEHLVETIAQVSAALLAACAGVRILATSREPLGVPGEVAWAVPMLSLPDPQPWRGPVNEQEILTAYQQSEAVQLFAARAASAAPGFKLDAHTIPWAADICRRLDGIPLAIELAAARLHAFSARQIAERLDDRFQLLTSRLRTAAPRHQTLEATLDWSYQLLSDTEQKVFRRLSVFANGWELKSAEAVCSDADLTQAEVMVILSNLVEKSLVMVDRSRGMERYRLLETIRQYAYQKLQGSGEADTIRDWHLEYFLRWAEMGAEYLSGPEQSDWLERFDIDHDNLRAALEWSQHSADRQAQGVCLAGACGKFWRLRGYFREGRERLAKTILLPGAQERTKARANVLLWAANLAYIQSDYPATRVLAEEGLAICRELGPAGRPGVARALELLGELATEVGDYETAPRWFEEALTIYRDLNEKRGIADMLMQLGWAAMRAGDYEQADAFLNECLPLFRTLNESARIGIGLAGLGELSVRQKRLERANELLEESLALHRELGDRWGTAVSLGSLGWVALLQRDMDRMRAMLGESLAIRMEIGDLSGTAWCFEKLAEGNIFQSRALSAPHNRQALQLAGQLLGAAAALRAPINSVIDPADRPQYERMLQELRRALGVTALDAVWGQAAKMPVQEIIDLALAPISAPADSTSLSSSQAAKAKYGGLTARERKTAVLIAQGKTNREIAETMIVRVKTVETYVTRILNKLGFDSRVQIATWAIGAGLTEQDQDD